MSRSALMLPILLLACACGGDGAAAPPALGSVSVAPRPPLPQVTFSTQPIELVADLSTAGFEYTASGTDYDPERLTFVPSDPEIFAITDEGRVVGRSGGTARLEARYDGYLVATLPVTITDISMYVVGNSHTWDFRPSADFQQLAAHEGLGVDVDYHIFCANSLTNIVAMPEETCVDPRNGYYREAFAANAFDIITLQPYPGGATFREEADAVIEMLQLIRGSASSAADVYIYVSWPENTADDLDSFAYTRYWENEGKNGDFRGTTTGGFEPYLRQRLAQAGLSVAGIIPAGGALNAFHREAVTGYVPGYSGAGQLYRDPFHMNNVGSFLMGATVLHTVFPQADLSDNDFAQIPGYGPYDENDTSRRLDPTTRSVIVRIVNETVRGAD